VFLQNGASDFELVEVLKVHKGAPVGQKEHQKGGWAKRTDQLKGTG